MYPKPILSGVLAVVVSISAGAAPLPGTPSPANASTQTNAPPQSNAPAPGDRSAQGKAQPISAQHEKPGAIAIASPNQRNTGTTVATPDGALFGKLNLHTKERPFEEPPALQPVPAEAPKSGGSGNTGAPAPAHN